MGCWFSVMAKTELVTLCKERKQMIKAARDWHCALALAHISCFQSLFDVGNSLYQMVEEDMVISVDPASNSESDHQLAAGEGCQLESDTDITSFTDRVHGRSKGSYSSFPQVQSQPRGTVNVYQVKKSSEEVLTVIYEPPPVVNATVQWYDTSNLVAENPQFTNGVSSAAPMKFQPNHPRAFHDQNEAGNIHLVNPQDTTAQWYDISNLGARYPQHSNAVSSDAPINFQPNDPRSLQYENQAGAKMTRSLVNPRFSIYGDGLSFSGSMNFGERNQVSSSGPMNFPPINRMFPSGGDRDSLGSSMNLPPNNHYFPQHENSTISDGPMIFTDNNLQGMESDLTYTAFRFPQYVGVPNGDSMNPLFTDPYSNSWQSPIASPSPPDEVSTWDYPNPFSEIDDTISRYYFEGRYRTSFSNINPNLQEVREREGIPDLEEETEEELIEEEPKEINSEVKNKRNADEGPSRTAQLKEHSFQGSPEAAPLTGNSGKGSTEAAPAENSEDNLLTKDKGNGRNSNESNCSRKEKCNSGETIGVQGAQKQNCVSSEKISSTTNYAWEKDPEPFEKGNERKSDELNCLKGKEASNKRGSIQVPEEFKQDDVSSVHIASTTANTQGSRDLKEVLKEIRDASETAFDHGKEVSVALETEKLQYQSTSVILKGFSSWILSFLGTSLATPSSSTYMKLKRSAFGAGRKAKSNRGSLEQDIFMNSTNLSSTLEKLYLWEKKLYKEVKDEERLRVVYAKEWKKLKKLDDRGADCYKIDATQDSIRRLQPKMNVVVLTIDAISRRIHKLRDEELHLQLNELVQRLTGMWKFMVEFHQKQFRVMVECRTHVQISEEGLERNKIVKVIQKLETGIVKWAKDFIYWIYAQKAFVKFLNGCLMKHLPQKPEDTTDGIATYSPRRLGAPPVFITCKHWYNAIENISETEVSKAMYDFASMLHQLVRMLNKERRHRLKIKSLGNDLDKQVKYYYKLSGMKWEEYVLSGDAAAFWVTTESGLLIPDAISVDVEPVRIRLSEEKRRHEESIRELNDAASQGLREGLIRIFEAMSAFSIDMYKAYEQVSNLGKGGKE